VDKQREGEKEGEGDALIGRFKGKNHLFVEDVRKKV